MVLASCPSRIRRLLRPRRFTCALAAWVIVLNLGSCWASVTAQQTGSDAAASQPAPAAGASRPPDGPDHLHPHSLDHQLDHAIHRAINGALAPNRPATAPTPAASPAPALAIIDATSLGSSMPLDYNWRIGIAASEAPADPAFDDSAWPVRDVREPLPDLDDTHIDNVRPDESGNAGPKDARTGQPRPDAGGGGNPDANSGPSRRPNRPFVWFRLHIKLPPHHGSIVILNRLPILRSSSITIGAQAVGMDVFANGKRVVPEGPNADAPEGYQQISRIYPLDIPDGQTDLVLAIRIPYIPFGLDSYTGFFGTRTFSLGEGDDLRLHLTLWDHGVLFDRLPELIDNGLKILLAVFLLALFWTQKDHTEYLWLGLNELMVAPLAWVDLIGSTARLEVLSMAALVVELLLVSSYFYFEFLIAFLSLRRRWYITAMRYSAPLLLAVGPLLQYARYGHGVEIALVASLIFAAVWVVAWVLFIGINLIAAAVRRNYEAALLLLPLLLSLVGLAELVSTTASSTFLSGPMQSPLTFQAGPIPIHFSAIADLVGVLVIVLIVFVRFLRILRERERAASELAAARSVQELMIPRESPRTPGFQVDTVYTPAQEVGGDFFHIQATGDGGLLVVIGDVAGKGLQAAMNVSMIMGALRCSPQSRPAEILSDINEVLAGSSSLTTCQVAYFASNGELILASAGHPPPYLNSQEVTLPGGLPLGVVSGISYEETRLFLHPGDRLLMMSDGVAEARKPNGELFGFERVHNLSAQSAFFIADAAKEFGQEDDITVLTIRRLSQAAAA